MVEHRVGAVAVTSERKVAGIFTERDLMTRVAMKGLDIKTTKIVDVMTKDVATVADATSVKQAVAIMRKHGIRHLPVLDRDGNVEGMVSLRYLLFDIVDDLEKEATSLESYAGADGPGG
jgi:CBS domain-containing protein